jgi:delta-aminolevulinic acid dehydratase/porphobilinogen synthase
MTNKTLEQQIEELEKLSNREVNMQAHPIIINHQKGQESVAKKALLVINQLQKDNERLREVIEVVDICLSDYVITEHGLKIINEKDLKDAEDTLKQIMKEFK